MDQEFFIMELDKDGNPIPPKRPKVLSSYGDNATVKKKGAERKADGMSYTDHIWAQHKKGEITYEEALKRVERYNRLK